MTSLIMGKDRLRRVATGVVVLALAAGLAACGGTDKRAPSIPAEPSAGGWKTWVLSSVLAVPVPAPPAAGSAEAKADLAAVRAAAKGRTEEVRSMVERWNGPLATKPWTEVAFEFVKSGPKDPPLSSRNYALVHAAMYDATLAAYYYKYRYKVEAPQGVSTLVETSPDPSYPSEHAAIAGAASKVLAYLYPNQPALRLDQMAEEAAQSRVQSGVNTPSDVAAGLDLGRAVAEKVIAYAKSDGSDKKWDGTRPAGIGRGPAFWEPVAGSTSPPVEPLAGTWRTWAMTSGSQFRPPPPPAYGSPEFIAAANSLIDIRKNLTPEQEQAVKFYSGVEGTTLPAGIIANVSQDDVLKATLGELGSVRLTVPRAVRAMALLTIAMADAGIAAWDAKFAYWNPRPEQAIKNLGLDPNFKPIIDTPKFPAYMSGSSTYAGAGEAVMSYLFPERSAEFRMRAEEQARSRIWAGIHWEYDEIGLPIGRQIGQLVVDRARKDGADKR